MGLVDAGVEDADLDARARVRDSPDRRPSGGRVDHADGTVHGGRVGEAGLDQRDPGARFKRVQARAVELHRDAIQHRVVLADHLRKQTGGLEPLSEVVARVGERCLVLAVGPRREVELAVLVPRGVGPVGERRLGEDHQRIAVGDAGSLRESVRVVDEGARAKRGREDCAQQTAEEASIHGYLRIG